MKFIIIFISLFLSLTLDAQTKIDSLVIDKINSYRVSKSLKPYSLDINCFKSAKLQTDFLLNNSKTDSGFVRISHNGDKKTPKPIDRYIYTSGETPKNINENITYIDNFNYRKGDDKVLNDLAQKIVDNWIKSPNHNKNLLSDNNYCGVSIKYYIQPTGLKDYVHYTTFGTFVSVR